MKVLLSSKYLAKELKKIHFKKGEYVIDVYVKGKEFHIITTKNEIVLDVEYTEDVEIITQTEVRWDWVKDLVTQVNEQPVVLVIYENQVHVVFQY